MDKYLPVKIFVIASIVGVIHVAYTMFERYYPDDYLEDIGEDENN